MRRTPPTRAWTAPLLAALLGAAACGGEQSYEDGELKDLVEPEDTAAYASEVPEGRGAAIALLIDNSGSMADAAPGDERPKYLAAREAIEEVLRATRAQVGREPGFPIKVGIYRFSGEVETVLPIQDYDSAAVAAALAQIPEPGGGTAIGDAMARARADLYRSGVFRKYLLVVSDGENNEGAEPGVVAREIRTRSQGGVQMFFVAFDVDAEKFGALQEQGVTLASARGGEQLRQTLAGIYEGKILAEAADSGVGAPPAGTDTARTESTQP